MDNNSTQKDGEVTVQITIPPITITIRSNNESRLQQLLEKSLTVVTENREKILALMPATSTIRRESPPSDSAPTGEVLPQAKVDEKDDGLSQVVKVFADGSVKLQSKKVQGLKGSEIAAIILAALKKPLRPLDISTILSSAWKKVSESSVSVYLSRELKPYVAKNEEGKYHLNGAGEHWVQDELLQKCLEPN